MPTVPCSAYRGLYIINWVYRYFTEPHYRQWLVWISGVVQTALYAGAWGVPDWWVKECAWAVCVNSLRRHAALAARLQWSGMLYLRWLPCPWPCCAQTSFTFTSRRGSTTRGCSCQHELAGQAAPWTHSRPASLHQNFFLHRCQPQLCPTCHLSSQVALLLLCVAALFPPASPSAPSAVPLSSCPHLPSARCLEVLAALPARCSILIL